MVPAVPSDHNMTSISAAMISDQFDDADESELSTSPKNNFEQGSSASAFQLHHHAEGDTRNNNSSPATQTTSNDQPKAKKARTSRYGLLLPPPPPSALKQQQQQPPTTASDASTEEVRSPPVVTPEPSVADANSFAATTAAAAATKASMNHHHHPAHPQHHFATGAAMMARQHQASLLQSFLTASAAYYNGNFAQAPSYAMATAAISQRQQQPQPQPQQSKQQPQVRSNLQPILPNPATAPPPFLAATAATTTNHLPVAIYNLAAAQHQPHHVPTVIVNTNQKLLQQQQKQQQPMMVVPIQVAASPHPPPEPKTKGPAQSLKKQKGKEVKENSEEDIEKKWNELKKEGKSKMKPDRNVSSQVDKWTRRYEQAKMFAARHGHCIIPNEYDEIPGLGSWAKRQRYQYQIFCRGSVQTTRMSNMNPDRIRLLDSIGFCWHHKDRRWLSRYSELLQFIHEYGHTAVPTMFEGNQELAGWVKVQRRQYKLYTQKQKSSMTEERIKLLNKVGFVWSIKEGMEALLDEKRKALEDTKKNNAEPMTTSTDGSEVKTKNIMLQEAMAVILKKDRTIVIPTQNNQAVQVTPSSTLHYRAVLASLNKTAARKEIQQQQQQVNKDQHANDNANKKKNGSKRIPAASETSMEAAAAAASSSKKPNTEQQAASKPLGNPSAEKNSVVDEKTNGTTASPIVKKADEKEAALALLSFFG